MIQHCDPPDVLNTAQRAEYQRAARHLGRYGALAKRTLNQWELSHQLRDAFFIRDARCDGRFHLYEAASDPEGKVWERAALDCPRWRIETARRESRGEAATL